MNAAAVAILLATAADPLADRINEIRRVANVAPLRWDGVAVPVLKSVARAPADPPLTPTQIYARISEARGYSAPGFYRSWRAATAADAVQQALWAPNIRGSYTHVALVAETLPSGEGVAALYLSTQPLPDGAAGLAKGSSYHCPSCHREWRTEVDERPHEGCPQCELLEEGYLDDTGGHYHWATFFARPYVPMAVDNPFLAWKWTNEAIRYDDEKRVKRIAGWQTPAETVKRKTGVCRDTAVLLAAWLRAMRVDARVVSGFSGEDAHAWVIMTDGDKRYLLETAMDGPMNRRFPPRLELETDYRPGRLMFDDRRVWLNRGRQRVRDYLSAAIWAEVKEAP
jgi:hypothetical protein